jgi:hypothetical protein
MDVWMDVQWIRKLMVILTDSSWVFSRFDDDVHGSMTIFLVGS